jgi:hypothetical protein
MPTFRELYLPYCLDRQEDGRYAVLNRRYKPVGTTTDRRNWVDYGDPHLVKLSGLTPAACRALSFNGSEDTSRIYLYNDGCVPTDSAEAWEAYCRRLQRLAQLKAEP